VTLGFNLADGWEIKYKDIALDVDDWPRVVSIAKKTSIRLVLSKKYGHCSLHKTTIKC
jgi:hypothetical protein